MNYGTSSYGSTAIAGSGGGQQVFLPFLEYAAGTYEGKAEFSGDSQFYSVLARVGSDGLEVSFQVFTHNDPDETPILQTSFGGFGLYHQAVVGAARFIIVQASLPFAQYFTVTGRPGN